jgi:hypothetical protein
MPPKTPKRFEGEGNPVEIAVDLPAEQVPGFVQEVVAAMAITLSDAERDVLRVVLDRDRTSKLVHGGLKSLLTLTDDQATTLLGLLNRV